MVNSYNYNYNCVYGYYNIDIRLFLKEVIILPIFIKYVYL